MGRPSNTKERRAQIIEGLQIAMAEKGYEKASIQSIAKAAQEVLEGYGKKKMKKEEVDEHVDALIAG